MSVLTSGDSPVSNYRLMTAAALMLVLNFVRPESMVIQRSDHQHRAPRLERGSDEAIGHDHCIGSQIGDQGHHLINDRPIVTVAGDLDASVHR